MYLTFLQEAAPHGSEQATPDLLTQCLTTRLSTDVLT